MRNAAGDDLLLFAINWEEQSRLGNVFQCLDRRGLRGER
jgi:hypothetical protein